MPAILTHSLILIVAYLLGSIPFGYIVGRCTGIDIRKAGSGNIGATNIQRVLGTKLGLLVLALDALKGVIAVVIALLLTSGESLFPVWAAIAAALGHSYSVFLKFHGGRAVSVSLGCFLVLAPIPVTIALGTFILTVALTRYVSVGSILAAVVFMGAEIVRFIMGFDNLPLMLVCVLIAVLIIVRHRANIERLRDGTENRISFKKKG